MWTSILRRSLTLQEHDRCGRTPLHTLILIEPRLVSHTQEADFLVHSLLLDFRVAAGVRGGHVLGGEDTPQY